MTARERKPLVLRPCPFCGEAPEVLPLDPRLDGDAWTRIQCDNATCRVKPSVEVYADRGHRATAARYWNFRP